MQRYLLIFTILVSFCASAQDAKNIPTRPSPPKLVNDLTGNFLTAQQKEALEQKLEHYNDSTSTQIAIVVVESLEGNSVYDYAMAIGRSWGVGNKEFNNGVVILVSTGGGAGNRKVAIAVGYGLEGAIPDLTTKSIIDNELVPNFKEGNYYRGLDEATDALIAAAAGRYKAPAGYGSKKGIGMGTILFIIIVLFSIISSIGNKKGGGGMVSRRGYGGFGSGWLLGSLMGGGWSGGGGGGGGGSGGGFGGFGGGGFGGGGSSGSW